ncbi:ABC transporter substrate-binding protein [Sutterella sp.]|uniref:ABC transporter substrate-binding protein n=1 Tax=Sutterella sp. TaxID=1981025 RepID=UPI0026E09794|nr:ABC transporter substrate-binding protein [Sutterella sp.]MDO5531575.1 ABC transporter substrate-binding protein [Sutterella sp.]
MITLRTVAALLPAALLLAAPAQSALAAQPRVLTAAVPSNFSTLDTFDAMDNLSRAISRSIYEGLYTFDRNLQPVPQLADSYTVSKDGLVYDFKLKEGVKFHDGTEFDAAAVVMNFERGMNPESKLSRRNFFKFVDKVEATGRYSVRFTLKTATAGFIQRLSNGTASMICPSLIKRATSKQVTAHEACGTGPYVLKRFTPSDELYAEKFKDYRVKGLPKFDAIRWVAVAENSTRAAMLQTGEAQFISPVPSEQFRQLERDKRLTLISAPSVVTRFLSMNEMKKPFDDVRVRQAINYAINREALVKVAYNGFAEPSTGYMPPQLEGAVSFGVHPYDPKKARELLKEAGYPNGLTTTLWSGYTDGKTLKTLQFLQQQLAAVGIRVTTKALESGERSQIYSLKDPAQSKHALFLIGWTNSAGEPDWALRPQLDSRSVPPAFINESYYRNPKVDELLDRAIAETDKAKRVALYEEIQRIVNADSPWAPLVFEHVTAGTAKELRNFFPMPDGSFGFYEAEWVED